MANTYKALSTVTVGAGGAASITFTNIPQTYTDLVVQVSGRDTRSNQTDDFAILFNGSTTTYTYQGLVGTGSSASGNYNTFSVGGIWNGNTATANTFSNGTLYIPNYTSSNPKVISSDTVMENNATFAEQWFNTLSWNTSAPITSITIQGNGAGSTVLQYSTATLYGVFNADVSSAPATPTIGTATATGTDTATVAFTGVSNAASYTATSTPGSLTATGATSPLTVSGLTGGTSYTFTVKSNNPFGSSANSAASNSITTFSPAFESIATANPNGASVTFSSIPQTYKHLQIRGVVRSATYGGAADYYSIRINGDSGANYNASGVGNTNTTPYGFDRNGGQTEIFAGEFPGATAGADQFGGIVIDIFDYTDTSKVKTLKYYNESIRYGQGSAGLSSGLWNNTAAITSISLTGYFGGGFANFSQLALYGIKG